MSHQDQTNSQEAFAHIKTELRSALTDTIKEALGGIFLLPALGASIGALAGVYGMVSYGFGAIAILIGAILGLAAVLALKLSDW